MTLRHHVIHGIKWGAGSRYTSQIITWVMTIYVMRLLTPADYGLVAMAGVFIAFALMISELGIGPALIQTKTLDDSSLRQSFSYVMLICNSLFVIIYFSAPLFVMMYHEPRLLVIVQLMSLQFIMYAFYVIPFSLLNRQMKFKELGIIDLSSSVGGGLLVLVLALHGFGAISLVVGNLGIILIKTVAVNLLQPVFFRPTTSLKEIRTLISFGRKVTLTRFLFFIFSQADIMIIGKMLGKDALGYYSVGMNLANIPIDRTAGILSQVSFPAYSSLQHDRGAAADYFLKAVRVISLMFIPLLWGMSSLGAEFIPLLLGSHWSMAAIPFQLICLIVPVRMLNVMFTPLLDGMGRPDLSLKNILVAAIVMPLGFLAGTHFGIIGVSMAWLLLYPAVYLFNMHRTLGNMQLQVSDIYQATRKSFFAAAVMYLTIIIIKKYVVSGCHAFILMPVCIISGILVYFGISYMINRPCLQEVYALLKPGKPELP